MFNNAGISGHGTPDLPDTPPPAHLPAVGGAIEMTTPRHPAPGSGPLPQHRNIGGTLQSQLVDEQAGAPGPASTPQQQALAELTAASGQFGHDLARTAFTPDAQAAMRDARLREHSVTLDEFDAFLGRHGGVFAPNMSYGRAIHSLNDHAGVLVLNIPAQQHGATLSRYLGLESLEVVDDLVRLENGSMQMRRMVAGDGNRLIRLADLERAIVAIKAAPVGSGATQADGPADCGTPLRGAVRELAEASTLRLRHDRKESLDKVIDDPDNLDPMPPHGAWANATHAMQAGIGPRNADGLHDMYVTFDRIDNHLSVFKRGKYVTPAVVNGVPRSVTVDGASVADLYGVDIDHVEVLGPRGEAGKKGAKLDLLRLFADPEAGPGSRQDVTTRWPTEDGAVHQMVVGDNGIEMALINPVPPGSSGAVFGAPPARRDGDNRGPRMTVYSYDGRYNGPLSTRSGHPESAVILSTGKRLPVAPFLASPAGAGAASAVERALAAAPWHGSETAAVIEGFIGDAAEIVTANVVDGARIAGTLATGAPLIEGQRGAATHALNTAIRATVSAAIVVGMSALMEAAFHHDEHGAIAGGSHGFSAAGGGQAVSKSVLFSAIATMVVVQEMLSVLFPAGSSFIPARVKDRESKLDVALNDIILPAVPEFTRLAMNMVVQLNVFGFARGSKVDIASLGGLALANATLDTWLGNRQGEDANHVLAAGLNKVVRFGADMAGRGAGNVFSSSQFDPDHIQADLGEAMVTRVITRVMDKAAMPILANVFNATGVIGPNASAYAGQVAREGGGTRYSLPGQALRGANAVAGTADRLLARTGDTTGLREAVQVVNDQLDKVKRAGNRFMLHPKGELPAEMDAVRRAATYHRLDATAQAAHEAWMAATFRGMLADAPGGGPRAVQSNRSQLPVRSQQYMRELDARVAANNTPAARSRSNYSPYPAEVGHDGRTRPAGYKKSSLLRMSDAERIPKFITTWSLDAQAYAMPTHGAMLQGPGLMELRLNGKPLQRPLRLNMGKATFDYTLESQYINYTARYQETGQPMRQPVAPGIDFVYNVMVKPGNADGASAAHRMGGNAYFDPIEMIYINLGANLAKKFPAIVRRAVVTEAPYLQDKPEDGSPHVAVGDLATLTEILSATMSQTMAASFGQALGFGAAPPERSLLVVARLPTNVNVTHHSDQGQAEIIDMPGTVLELKYLDTDPPPPTLAPGQHPDLATNIGQVAYMEGVDTARLEQHYIDFLDGKLTLEDDGMRMAHPASGHMFRYDARLNAAVYENPTKNYFLGRDLETPEQSTEKARWRHPFTSDHATRAIKDAIHAAILRNDPISEHLDLAVANVSHEHYRQQLGYYDTGRGQAERALRVANRSLAAHVAADMPRTPDGALAGTRNGLAGELLAWTVASMMRLRVALVPVQPDGTVRMRDRVDLDKTYDKVGLHRQLAMLVGVGEDGYYALRYENGTRRAYKIALDGAGHTAGNLLHVLNRAAYADDGQYRLGGGAGRQVATNGSMRHVVNTWLPNVTAFAGNGTYHVWSEGLLEKYRALTEGEAAPEDGATGKGKGPAR